MTAMINLSLFMLRLECRRQILFHSINGGRGVQQDVVLAFTSSSSCWVGTSSSNCWVGTSTTRWARLWPGCSHVFRSLVFPELDGIADVCHFILVQ